MIKNTTNKNTEELRSANESIEEAEAIKYREIRELQPLTQHSTHGHVHTNTNYTILRVHTARGQPLHHDCTGELLSDLWPPRREIGKVES